MKCEKKKTVWLTADILFAAALTALDQFTKHLAVSKLMGHEPFVILKGIFELDYLENRGSAFGMFQGQKIFLLCVGVVFLGIMFFLFSRTPAEKKFLPIHLAAVGIVAGGLGNMIDRIRLGYVVDFFSFVLIHFPVFNVADICVTVGMALFLIYFIFIERREHHRFEIRQEIKRHE